MIKFKSVGNSYVLTCGVNYIGCSLGASSSGVKATYGQTAYDMGARIFIMVVRWSFLPVVAT